MHQTTHQCGPLSHRHITGGLRIQQAGRTILGPYHVQTERGHGEVRPCGCLHPHKHAQICFRGSGHPKHRLQRTQPLPTGQKGLRHLLHSVHTIGMKTEVQQQSQAGRLGTRDKPRVEGHNGARDP